MCLSVKKSKERHRDRETDRVSRCDGAALSTDVRPAVLSLRVSDGLAVAGESPKSWVFIRCGRKKPDKADDVCHAYISSIFHCQELELARYRKHPCFTYFTLIYIDNAPHEATRQEVKAFP